MNSNEQITLRDYFASQIFSKILEIDYKSANSRSVDVNIRNIVKKSYQYADIMLIERAE